MIDHPNAWLVSPDIPYEIPEQFLDFKNFYTYIMKKTLGLDPTRIQLDMADFMQSSKGNICIQAPRKEGKSEGICIFAAWGLYLDPWLTIEIVSSTGDLADKNSRFIKRILRETKFLSHLLPGPGQLDRVDIWATAYAPIGNDHPNVKCVGITGGITGTHAQWMIPDDIENSNNSSSSIQREALQHQIQELDHVQLQDDPKSRQLWIGTPHTEESMYNNLPGRGFEVRIWPRQYGYNAEHYQGSIAPMILEDLANDPSLTEGGVFGMGKSTDPERWPDDLLARMAHEDQHGRSSWMLQLMLDTRAGLADMYPLKVQDLIVTDVAVDEGPDRVWHSTRKPLKEYHCLGRAGDVFYEADRMSSEHSKWDRKIAFLDTSGKGTDSTALAIGFLLNGVIHVYDVIQFADGYDKDKTLIPLCQALHKAGGEQGGYLYYEENFGGGMIGDLLQPVVREHAPGWTFDPEEHGIRVNKQKEQRIIDTVEPVLSTHRLVFSKRLITNDYKDLIKFPPGTANQYSLVYQLARITKERNSLGHDDALDALAGMVDQFSEHMRVDEDLAAVESASERDAEMWQAYAEEWEDSFQPYGNDNNNGWSF